MPLYASGLQSHLGNLAVIEVLGKNARPPTVRDRQAFSQTTDFGATDDGCTIQLSEGRPPLAVGSAVSVRAQMIWLITIAIFVGAVVAVMFVLWFFFQREQILAALRKPEEQRMEARSPTKVGLEFFGPDEPLVSEIIFTENVSRHGARVVSKRRWSPNDSVLVKLPQESLPSRARITYCQPLKGDEFAMGLQFSLLVYDWIGSP